MATVTSKVMFRGAASTSNTTLYTVPSGTTAVVTSIIVTNTSASSLTFTLNLDGVALQTSSSVPGNSSAYLETKQVLAATKTITGSGSSTSLNFHISGVEIA